MGDRSGHDPSRPARRAQTVGECARSAERDLLRAVDRLSMEGTPQGSAAEEHGATTYLELWNWDGTLEHIHHALYVAVREGICTMSEMFHFAEVTASRGRPG